jgi:hypothetical protein
MIIAAMKQALEAFDAPILSDEFEERMQRRKACDALRQAILLAEQNDFYPDWNLTKPLIDRIAELETQMCDQAESQQPMAWHNAALRLGEELSSVGPDLYYNMTAEQWLDWALDQRPRGKNSLPALSKRECVEPTDVNDWVSKPHREDIIMAEEFMDFGDPKNWKEFKNDTWDNSNVDPLPEQPEQEPVAWMQKDHLQKAITAPFMCRVEPSQRLADLIPIYTAPPKREWVGLTDAEIADAVDSPLDEVYLADFRKVIAKLKEYNT